MISKERQDKIVDLLEKERVLKSQSLVRMFNVSSETIRRDLEYLEKQGILKRVHGGASIASRDNRYAKFMDRLNQYKENKEEIAKIACKYIKEGNSIAMDASTTNLHIAREIKKSFEKLTIITNSMLIASELLEAHKFNVIVLGGNLNKEEVSMEGSLALDGMDKFNVDIAFIGVSAISINDGLTDYDFNAIQLQKKMIKKAKLKIALADSSKFENVALLKVCSVDEIDKIITDSNLDKDILKRCLKENMPVENTSFND